MLFTTDWFSGHIPLWEKTLLPLAGQPLQILEVGTYEGRSACWLAEHLLTHPESRLTSVDPYARRLESGQTYWAFNLHEVLGYARASLQTRLMQESSFTALPTLVPKFYDLIYIDGDHHGSSVIRDGCNAWTLLKSGGLLIFDDYEWSTSNTPAHQFPKPAIDYFLTLYRDQLEIVHTGWQVIVKKRLPIAE